LALNEIESGDYSDPMMPTVFVKAAMPPNPIDNA
jgi:hypothetical protein